MKKLEGAASDSIILTVIQFVTSAVGLIVTKLMSVRLSLTDYGTYSQAMLIVATATSLLGLGLVNAVNFYYNSKSIEEDKEKYIGTLFGLQYIVSGIGGIVIILIQIPLINYFNNEQLRGIIYLIAFMPLFENLMPMLQVLFISCGKAKVIAIRNFVVSTLRLVIVVVTCFITNNILTILVFLLIMDIAQVLYFMLSFARMKFRISILKFSVEYVPEVLRFCIPMAVYIASSSIARDIDKYIVSFFSDTETFAIYSNASKALPFDLVTASFITVLIPIITRQIGSGQKSLALATFKEYLRIGYIVTWIVAFGAIVNAKELMQLLYDKKFLPGLTVFIMYIIVVMIKFANTSLILVACGKTKTLMYCSIISMMVNAALSLVLYNYLRIMGPAIATMLVSLATTIALLIIGARELDSNFFQLFDWKELLVVFLEMLAVGAVSFVIKLFVNRITGSPMLVFIISYGFFVIMMTTINIKRIRECLSVINHMQ